jgi:glycosyltransferase involved in cell wall biosynthesis
MKIAIVVHGRFHAFELVRALLARGEDVLLLTNYPKSMVEKFGVPRERVRSFLFHGVVSRLADLAGVQDRPFHAERLHHTMFGRWAARQLADEAPDVIYSWSGVSEEILRVARSPATLRLVVRGSAHIRVQARLLADEEKRTGIRQQRPSSWRIEREEIEYRLADAVMVLSSFSYRSFVEQGFPEERLRLMISGVRVEAFRPPESRIADRCRRIQSGAPLRILNVGNVSFQKGLWDLAAMARELDPKRFDFRCVGAIAPEAARFVADLRSRIEFIDRLPQEHLPAEYDWADVFVFPTIQDGFPAVCAQAAAAGLPVLTTTNGAGTDLVRPGETGWVFPIRDPKAFIERLKWCDDHRDELATMSRAVYESRWERDWSRVAEDFVAISGELLSRRQDAHSRSLEPGLLSS